MKHTDLQVLTTEFKEPETPMTTLSNIELTRLLEEAHKKGFYEGYEDGLLDGKNDSER